MSITLIEMEHDAKKHRWVLWSRGNYQYEIENRHTGYKIPLDLFASDDSLAEAKKMFWLTVKG